MPVLIRWSCAVALALLPLCAGAQALVNNVAPAAATAAPTHEVQVDNNAFRWDSRPAWIEPDPAGQSPDASPKRADPLYYALRETQFLAATEPAFYVHQVLVATESSVLTQLGQFEIDFVPAWQQVRLHAVHIRRDGDSIDKQASTQIRFLERELGLEHGVYTGQVTASLLIDDVRVGDALDIEYTTIGRNPVFPDRFADSASWDRPIPTQLRRVVLKAAKTRHIAWRMFGPDDAAQPKPASHASGNDTVTVFEGRDLIPPHLESNYPPDYAPLRWIDFSEYHDWNDVANWATGLFRDAAPDPAVVALAATFKSEPDPAARALAALQYVQREIRYFSIALGESSHRPSAPGVTLQRRYGDCKDKAALLLALLRELAIPANAVLVPSARSQDLAHKLPAPDHFDHVIVRLTIAGHDHFVDPTLPEQTGRLDALYSWHEGVDVLVVAGDTRQPFHLPTRTPVAAQFETIEKMDLPAFGEPLTLNVETVMRDQFAEIARIALKRSMPQDRKRELQSEMTQRYEGAEMLGEPQVQDDPAAGAIRFHSSYRLPAKTLLERGSLRYVKFRPGTIVGHLPVPEPGRKAPLWLAAPQRYRYEFRLTAPATVAQVTDPQTRSIGKGYFSLQQQSQFRGNVASEVFELSIPERVIAGRDIADYAQELKKREELRAVVFLPDTGGAASNSKAGGGLLSGLLGKHSSPATAGAAPDPVAQRAQEDRDTIRNIDKTLEGSTLADRDRAAALVERGDAHDNLGESDLAVADFDAAIKLAPRNPTAHMERASSLFARGDFKGAIEASSRALALGIGDSSRAQTRRGIAAYFLGDRDAALDDFTHAASAAEHGPYSTLWYLIGTQHFAVAPASALLEAARAERQGQWPRPLFGLFSGDSSPADIEKSLDALNPVERRLNGCEAYFYLGEYFLNRHDEARARVYFERVIDSGVRFYTEYGEARLELKRLDATKSASP